MWYFRLQGLLIVFQSIRQDLISSTGMTIKPTTNHKSRKVFPKAIYQLDINTNDHFGEKVTLNSRSSNEGPKKEQHQQHNSKIRRKQKSRFQRIQNEKDDGFHIPPQAAKQKNTRIRRDDFYNNNRTEVFPTFNTTEKPHISSKANKPVNYDTKSILTWTRHYATNNRAIKKKKPQSLSLTGATIGGIILLLVGVIVVYFIWRLKNRDRSPGDSRQAAESSKQDDTEVAEGMLISDPNTANDNITI